MKFITLTTDYGIKDYYVSVVKAKLLDMGIPPSFSLIDITHQVPPFDTQVAAYHLNAWQAKMGFDAIHLIGVDSTTNRWIAVLDRGAFYVMPDNGIIALLDLTEQKQVYQFQELLFPTSFDDITIFASALDGILNQGELSQDWVKTQNYIHPKLIKPIVKSFDTNSGISTKVSGEIIYFDNYGNAITNINLKILPTKINLEKVSVALKYQREIIGVHRTYSELSSYASAQYFALFNSQDILEIGIFRSSSQTGGVEELLGLEKRDTVTLIY